MKVKRLLKKSSVKMYCPNCNKNVLLQNCFVSINGFMHSCGEYKFSSIYKNKNNTKNLKK